MNTCLPWILTELDAESEEEDDDEDDDAKKVSGDVTFTTVAISPFIDYNAFVICFHAPCRCSSGLW